MGAILGSCFDRNQFNEIAREYTEKKSLVKFPEPPKKKENKLQYS